MYLVSLSLLLLNKILEFIFNFFCTLAVSLCDYDETACLYLTSYFQQLVFIIRLCERK